MRMLSPVDHRMLWWKGQCRLSQAAMSLLAAADDSQNALAEVQVLSQRVPLKMQADRQRCPVRWKERLHPLKASCASSVAVARIDRMLMVQKAIILRCQLQAVFPNADLKAKTSCHAAFVVRSPECSGVVQGGYPIRAVKLVAVRSTECLPGKKGVLSPALPQCHAVMIHRTSETEGAYRFASVSLLAVAQNA
jgi:hypothetical protein